MHLMMRYFINVERLAAERQHALDLALSNEKSLLKERYQYKTELAKLKKKSSEDKSQTEHIQNLVAGLSSMNKSQEKLQKELRQVTLEKEKEWKVSTKLWSQQ